MGTANPEQFNIRWKNYTVVLQSVFRELLEDERLVDVTLGCEGGSIKCHRVILTACSVYFEKLLTQYPLETHLVIFMKDLKYWELQALVHFMYNGEVSVQQNRLALLVRAAESLKIRGLSSETESGFQEEFEKPDNEEDEDDIQHQQQQSKRPIPQLPIAHQRRSLPPAQGKSLLRPPSSAPSRMIPQNLQNPRVVQQNSAIKRPSLTNNGPPKLLKMQKVDDQQAGNAMGNGSLGKPLSSQPPKIIPQVVEKLKVEQQEENYAGEMEEEYFDENEEIQSNRNEGDGDVDGSCSDEIDENQSIGNVRKNYKYEKELKDSALAALNTGLSLAQCSDAFGIPKKTLSKWKCRSGMRFLASASKSEPIDDAGEIEEEIPEPRTIPVIHEPPMTEPVLDANDRAIRLKKATDLALSGITVRQAAAHYGIPRTTLCAYMKRQGLTGKRLLTNPQAIRKLPMGHNRLSINSSDGNNASSSNQNHADGFLFGLSDLVDDIHGGYEQEEIEGDGEGIDQSYAEDGEGIDQSYNEEDEAMSPQRDSQE